MSIFEHYTANVPMFMPSKQFAEQLDREGNMFQDLTFYRIYKFQEPDDPNNPLSLRNSEILRKWIDTCDFYDPDNMPHIIYFDNWSHLYHLLRTMTRQDMINISNKMKEFNIKRKEYVYGEWSKILNRIREINYPQN